MDPTDNSTPGESSTLDDEAENSHVEAENSHVEAENSHVEAEHSPMAIPKAVRKHRALERVASTASDILNTEVIISLREDDDQLSAAGDDIVADAAESSTSAASPSAPADSKKTAYLSGILGRLRGTPSPVKSAAAASSTTGLIFENRPANLPAKSAAEEKKHRQQYEAMLQAAEQKKRKEAGAQLREANDRLKREEIESNRLSVWLNEILPHWETAHTTRKARDLWWSGLPTRVRGQVWKRALGNDLQITQDLFEISKSRAAEMLKFGVKTADEESETSSEGRSPSSTPYLVSVKSRESSVHLIHLDVRRTFPHLGIFQEGGPLHSDLHDVLCAYSCYRPDMGYVQGMSFLAAVFILNMEPGDAFVCLANLLCKPVHMALFRMDATHISLYFNTFAALLDEALPKLAAHFKDQGIVPATFLVDWFFTSFSKSLPLESASRVWDVYFRDGDEFLFRTGLGILHLYQTRMLAMEFGDLAHFFTHLPEDLSADELFQSIAAINISTKRYQQVLTQQRDRATASC